MIINTSYKYVTGSEKLDPPEKIKPVSPLTEVESCFATMQSPRKLFHARPSLATRRSTALVVLTSLAIGIAGFTFGLAVIIFPGLRLTGRNCLTSAPPKTVRVVWDVAGVSNVVGGGEAKRHKVMGFVGIQTGFGSAGRRRALRKTWMPSDPEGLRRYIDWFWFSWHCSCEWSVWNWWQIHRSFSIFSFRASLKSLHRLDFGLIWILNSQIWEF